MLTRLAALAARRPRRILLLTALFLVVAGAFGGPVAGLLSTGDDFSDPSAESVGAYDRLERAAGGDAAPSVVVLVATGADVRTDPGARARLERVDRRVAADPEIRAAISYADRPDPAFAARDGRSAYVAGFVRAGGDPDDAVERLTDAFAGDRSVIVGGEAAAGSAVGEQVSEDLARAELLAFPLLFLLSLLVFRGLVAALLPLFVGLLTIAGTFLALRIVNEATLLSIFALNLATALGLGLAIDYSLFVVSRFREELARGADVAGALGRTMATAGRTVLFSSLTVAAAMLSLLVFPQRFLYSMGIAGAATALLAAAVSLVALPALLAVLGRRVDALAPRRWRVVEDDPRSGRFYRLAHAVLRRPGIVAVGTAAVLIAVGLPFAGVQFTGVDASVLPEDAPARIVDERLQADFPGARTEPVTVVATADRGDRAEVEALAGALEPLAGAQAVVPPRFLGERTWQVDVISGARPLDDRTLDLVRAIRATDTPVPIAVTGEAAEFVDQQEGLGARLPLALAVLGITTLVLLFAFTGSVVLPVKTLVMNLLTLAAAFGLLVLVFQDGRLEGLLDYTSQGALESTQPLVLLALVFGLSTDYGVFLLARIKEARDAGEPDDEAVALGLQRTGRIVTAAALLFSVAIGAFATSEITFIKQVGLGTAVAVLIDATIIRALLVPALMGLLGRWNWWAPRPLRRLHDRFGLAETVPPPRTSLI